MSKPHPNPQQPQLKLDLTLDLSLFCENIKSNFTLIWETLARQAQQLQSLKAINIAIEPNPQKNGDRNSRNSNRKDSKENSLMYSEFSAEGAVTGNERNREARLGSANGFTQSRVIKEDKEIPAEQVEAVQAQIVPKKENKLLQDLARNVKPVSHQQQQPLPKQMKVETPILPEHQDALIQTNPQNTQQSPETATQSPNPQNLSLMQSKIFQLNERLQKLQLASIKQSGNFSKKMNQLYLQVQKTTDSVNKKQSQLKKLEHLIDKLRGELSEYKLKKQSQLMRMANNGNGGSAGSGASNKEYNEFLLEKIQEISNCLPEFLLKGDFEDFRMENKIAMAKMERKIGEAVTAEEFQGLVAILGRKKNENLSNTGKINRQGSIKGKTDGQKVKPEDIVLDQVDPFVQLKLIALQKELKELKAELEQSQLSTEQKLQKQTQSLAETNLKLTEACNQILRSQHKSSQYEQFMRKMNESYNEKFKQIISQIVETQESIEKLNNQMKFYSFTSGNKSETQVGQVGPTSHSSGVISDGKIVDMENDIGLLKKKVNKLALKLQSFKEDILTVRQDFARECDGIKSMLEKKCDWESLKKGMHYFEERVKQIANYIQFLQKNMTEIDDNGQSTAAKKGWTCLCCDKDIKQYEGKLGEAKFTSIFPSRYESPRIGGYFKQKQTQKEYSQLFLKHNRRLSQNHTKSKDEIA